MLSNHDECSLFWTKVTRQIMDDEQGVSKHDDCVCDWATLPDLLLEKVFYFLSLRDRYHASTVCRHWYNVFYSPSIWRELVMTPTTFTHLRHTPYKGYWAELSLHKVQMCLEKVGSFLHTIQVEPVNEFYNLYEFLRILNVFLEFDQDDAPLQSLTNFYFTFCCEKLRNFTLDLYPVFVAGMFPNLTTLVTSPQQLSPDIVRILGNSKVTNLYIIQDQYCNKFYFIDKDIWKATAEKAPDLKVHLSARGETLLDINWQDSAPVTSIVYTTKHSKMYSVAIDTITVLYSSCLQVYGHFDLPRYHGSRSFTSRCDSHLVDLIKTCSKIHTLIVRERISTATLIILAREGTSLKKLFVRRNALLKRCDWQRMLMWDEDYYWTMRRCSHSYQTTFDEVSRCLGYQWQPLTDREFKRLTQLYCNDVSAQSDFDTT
ncbi:hypothetical protein EB796_012960 [Bugula neritina]|uniref:F-box domain-containing protein n=1 Tax=Bugula neritina TaxID=10212 RepID=A0A7J7JTL4_BUGNE|nr:hypothetical protein EB796_012960 [Bugula neritina]